MLGNDVVDRLDVDARPETFHRRFDARVFTPAERARLAADAVRDPVPTAGPMPGPALRWAHWAAKEAAYKLLRQRDPAFVFSPIRLEACFDAPCAGGPLGATRRGRLRVVSAPGPELELASFETPDFVHVLALPAGADWQDVVTAVEPLAGPLFEADEDPSRAVRRLALRRIAEALGVEAARLAIGRRGRIPTLELDGEPTSMALSLSHHGRFVAFAMTPRSAFAARDALARSDAAKSRGATPPRTGSSRPASGPASGRRRRQSGTKSGTEARGGRLRGGARRGRTDDGQRARAGGAVGCPARSADQQRKTG
ncbi:MAG: 4'-phosphopantetheinyl transferase superfamily protein [Myxococcota bacterium]